MGGKRLTNLRFAENIVLFASSKLKLIFQDLSRASLEVGLLMNWSKTQVMTNDTKRRVEVNGQAMMSTYTYLGQIVSFNNRKAKKSVVL